MDVNAAFPLTARVVRGEGKTLAVVIVFYLAVCAAAKLVSWLLGWVPVLGWVLRVLLWALGVYCVAGIVLAILAFFRTSD